MTAWWHDGPGYRLFTVAYVSSGINILALSSMSISVMCMCRCDLNPCVAISETQSETIQPKLVRCASTGVSYAN